MADMHELPRKLSLQLHRPPCADVLLATAPSEVRGERVRGQGGPSHGFLLGIAGFFHALPLIASPVLRLMRRRSLTSKIILRWGLTSKIIFRLRPRPLSHPASLRPRLSPLAQLLTPLTPLPSPQIRRPRSQPQLQSTQDTEVARPLPRVRHPFVVPRLLAALPSR